MSDLISQFKYDLFKLIDALESKNILNNFKKESINIDFNSKSKQGDISTNIFLVILNKNRNTKFNLRDYIISYLNNLEYIQEIKIAKAGFINLFIKKKYIEINLKKLFLNDFKIENKSINTEKINIEFVSANPTGPVHVAHIRGAVLGDVLASILQSVGHKVTREYYVNDSGNQIKNLGQSLFKRYLELFNIKIDLLKNEYPGKYLIDIAKNIKDIDGDKWIKFNDIEKKNKYFQVFAVKILINEIKNDLLLLNINFDRFTYESEIIKKNYIEKIFLILKQKDLIYEGILSKPLGDESEAWEPRKQLLFRSTKFSDDSDRPFKKANNEWTYFANDSAYHYEKSSRGFSKLINIWGADHIGYVSRMKSIVSAISYNNLSLDVFICQIVRLIKDGKILKMSKRDDNFITLKEIYNEVGKDPLRYYMAASKSETPMDFDLNKVVEKNKDNPVFYCQYAYARASSLIRKSQDIKTISNEYKKFHGFDPLFIGSHEWEIIFKLISWPYILKQAAFMKQPHRITNYLENLCSDFHSLWNMGKENESLRFIDDDNIKKTITKIIWIEAFRKVLNESFQIIGISSPDSM